MVDRYKFLRRIPLFEGLPEADLLQLCEDIEEVHLAPGEMLIHEGDMGEHAYVIISGQIEIYKELEEKTVQLDIQPPGAVIGEMSLIMAAPRVASGRAVDECTLLAIGAEQFENLLNTSPTAARVILQTVAQRLQSSSLLMRQNEKMAQLGIFAAGMAHELNNPSAAVQRSAGQQKKAFQHYIDLYEQLHHSDFTSQTMEEMRSLEERIRAQAAQPAEINLLVQSDKERQMEDWLEERGVDEAWNLAPQLVNTGISIPEWEKVLGSIAPEQQSTLLEWACASLELHGLMEEISHSAGRISQIVKALKSYVYLDQSPIQEIDLHKSLEDTLSVLQYKLDEEINVVKDFDSAVPPVLAYGSELNQVWTNLIDNAIDAIGEKGEILVKTTWRDPWVVVDICDSGGGIPPENHTRLFSPFFTTKPVGKGAGLGLHLSYKIVSKHGGEIRFRSQPGETHFEVWLPRDFEQARQAGSPAVPVE